jgi:hypothetical protein
MTNWASRTQPQSRRSLFGTTWHVKWLAQMFQSGSGQESLQFTNSDDADIEVLPVINTDGSVVIMISNHAVAFAKRQQRFGVYGQSFPGRDLSRFIYQRSSTDDRCGYQLDSRTFCDLNFRAVPNYGRF